MRVKEQGPSHYAGLYNVMKGVTLAGAGLALVNLSDQGVQPTRLALVAVALTGVLLTYYGQTVGFIIVHLRPSALDIAVPMLLTVAEFYVVYRPGVSGGGLMPVDWFVGLAAWALLAALVIFLVSRRLRRASYSSALWPIIEEYGRELTGDVLAASALGAMTIGYIVGRSILGSSTPVNWAFLAVVIGMLGIGINSQRRTGLLMSRRLGVEI